MALREPNSKRQSLRAELESLSPQALKKRKEINDVLNSEDGDLSPLEKAIKKRVVPLILPFLTIAITAIIFFFNYMEGQRSKATDRYKSELDLVKMVWADMKNKDTGRIVDKSVTLLAEMYSANQSYYQRDGELIGITENQRPIQVYANTCPKLKDALNQKRNYIGINNEARKLKAATSTTALTDPMAAGTNKDGVNSGGSVTELKPKEMVDGVASLAPDKLKVYIQFSSLDYRNLVDELSRQLGDEFVVPGNDYVANTSGYGNEIRYYSKKSEPEAISLHQKVRQITGLDFQLRNINRPDIAHTIEVWYDNKPKPVPSGPVETTVRKSDTEGYSIEYSGQHLVAKGFMNVITPKLTVYFQKYKTDKATLRVNGKLWVFSLDKNQYVDVDGKRVWIMVAGFGKNDTARDILTYNITVGSGKQSR
ncbi:hypothetical protein HYN48_07255 [Flavobacterium magnum]|uniref:Uncharacterized protein n=1 Tax=Flavobacterium magnum TaxID=2162713 RepID=A0A2S0RF24_9FLAO|nr:hypothetical protein [Flavobacterium magnum]AWA29890.1 hypothetical protein HYN48_07255 [Flavobacterium magnum]